MPIDTLANVKVHLGVSGSADDTLLGELMDAADAYVEEYCGRSFVGGSFTEDHPGGADTLFLKNYPVASVTAVKVDPGRQFAAGTTLDPSAYVVHADRGVIVSAGGPFVPSRPGWAVRYGDFPAAVRVTYTVATGAVPAAVCRAYAELVGHWYRQVVTHTATGQCNVGSATDGTTVTTYAWGQSVGYAVPDGVIQLLELYRVPKV